MLTETENAHCIDRIISNSKYVSMYTCYSLTVSETLLLYTHIYVHSPVIYK